MPDYSMNSSGLHDTHLVQAPQIQSYQTMLKSDHSQLEGDLGTRAVSLEGRVP